MKKMKSYLLYPLVLGCVCLVCGGTLATVNYLTKDTIQANIDKVANQAIYNVASKVNKTIDEAKGIKDADVNVAESKPFVEKKKSLFMVGEENQYYYYQLKTNKGFSGSVVLGALVSPENKVIATEFIGGDEDSLGISAAKKLLITAEDPYTMGGELKCGATAGKTLPAISEALDAILADASNAGGSEGGEGEGDKDDTHKEEYADIVKVSSKIDKNLIDDSVKDVEVKVEESKKFINEKKSVKFEGDEKEYFYFKLTTEKGFTGTVTFSTIIDGDKAISYNFISGDEDGLGLGVAKKIKINLETPYTKGGTLTSTGGTAAATLPAIGAALDAALVEAKGVPAEVVPEGFNGYIYKAAKNINKKVDFSTVEEADVVVTETIQYASTMNKRTFKFEGDTDTYFFYKLHTKVHESFTGEVEFGVIIDKEAKVISYVFIGGTEDPLGLAAARNVTINLEKPYTKGGEVQSGATAHVTLPAIGKAMDSAIADVEATLGGNK